MPGGRTMQSDKPLYALRCAAVAVGALALAGCVSDAYLYDADPGVYYRGSAGYPPYYYGYPRHYGYPGYYAPSGYYGYSPSPPRVVYFDHDHRGDDCRHPSHRDGRRGDGRDRDEHNDRDRPPEDRDGRPERRPQGQGPATPPPQWRNPPRGVSPEGPGAPPQAQPTTDDRGAAPNKRPPAEPRPDEPPRGMRALRVKQPGDADGKPEARKELD